MKTKSFKAFTLIELVLVIVVIGILSVMIIPRLNRNALLEAADQIVSHIRYTQHLAISDNKFNPARPRHWYRDRWTIAFSNNQISTMDDSRQYWRYHVYQDLSRSGNLNSASEVARDPQSLNRFLSSGWSGITARADIERTNEKLNISKKFGVINIAFGGGCPGVTGRGIGISFDEKGRPMNQVTTTAPVVNTNGAVNPANRLIVQNCTITLTNANSATNPAETAVITISPETGYTKITTVPQI